MQSSKGITPPRHGLRKFQSISLQSLDHGTGSFMLSSLYVFSSCKRIWVERCSPESDANINRHLTLCALSWHKIYWHFQFKGAMFIDIVLPLFFFLLVSSLDGTCFEYPTMLWVMQSHERMNVALQSVESSCAPPVLCFLQPTFCWMVWGICSITMTCCIGYMAVHCLYFNKSFAFATAHKIWCDNDFPLGKMVKL